MQSPHEHLSNQFYRWERRGRGWDIFDFPVALEPPFSPFDGHDPVPGPIIDDGRRPTFLSSLVKGLSNKLTRSKVSQLDEVESELEPEPTEVKDVVELRLGLPNGFDFCPEVFENFLRAVSGCPMALSFELLGISAGVVTQFAVDESDSVLVRRQMEAAFPEVTVTTGEGFLKTSWSERDQAETAIVEFGLSREFVLPLKSGRFDTFVGIAATLQELDHHELGLFQVLFQPVRQPWRESVVQSVTHADGKPFFVNAPELAKNATAKVSEALYAVVVRIAAQAPGRGRSWEIAREMSSGLHVLSDPNGNELIPLKNDRYPFLAHVEDLLSRQSRRPGMLLNQGELLGLVHLPTSAVPALERSTAKSKAARAQSTGLLLGENIHRGKRTEIRLTPEQRVRHTHIVGTSGTGKSTFIYNLIREDILNGEGVALLDPHGDLVDALLGIIPKDRVDDVILIDPSDEEYSVGFNILSAHSNLEKNLLASDLVSAFHRLSSSWGDQMASVLHNAITAFLESSRGGTLSDLRRFLLEPDFRHEFLATVQDPAIAYYWRKGFAQLTGNKSIGPVITRLENFLGRKPIRLMVSQSVNRLDFADIMDSGKIFLAKLSQGLIGHENSYLLGSLLVSKFQQTAMSRQAKAVRRDFWLYVDEFQNFITPSMAEILAGARKYRLGLVLAHQELRQLERDREVASAVFNCCTRVVFRVGDDDARKLSDGFASFETRDLQNLEVGQAICRIERSDRDFNLEVHSPEQRDSSEVEARRQEVIAASRLKYGAPISVVEAGIYEDLRIAVSISIKESARPESTQKLNVSQPKPAPLDVAAVPQPVPLEPGSKLHCAPRRSESRPLGRGGPQHVYLQHLIKEIAIAMKFEVDVEKTIPSGEGSVDVVVKKGEKCFAFEISVTTDPQHELGNIRKCLSAQFDRVVMVGVDATRLGKLKEAALFEFTPTEQVRIGFCLPDGIQAALVELSAMAAGTDSVSHGRKTKVTFRPLDEDEARRRREIVARVSTQSLKKLKKRGSEGGKTN
jgi:hypothetical protein